MSGFVQLSVRRRVSVLMVALAVLAFGISWFTKGKAILKD